MKIVNLVTLFFLFNSCSILKVLSIQCEKDYYMSTNCGTIKIKGKCNNEYIFHINIIFDGVYSINLDEFELSISNKYNLISKRI